MLPDEIISEILSPALKVSDELFSDTSNVSPFANYTPSTSAYLVVCKDWLRVATPLLYNVVVLRSNGQASALETVLRNNPDFGSFIKKLRVEGAYGKAMHTILKSAPNITDLFLSLAVWSSDNTQGLCKGLPLINPSRVIVMESYHYKALKNQQLAGLTKALFACIQKWDNLKIVGFPYGSNAMLESSEMERALNFAEALTQSPTVRTVVLSSPFYGLPQFLRRLCNIPSLQVLQFKEPFYNGHPVLSESLTDPQLKAVARYTMEDYTARDETTSFTVPDITPSLNLAFVPMESASAETQEIVWKRVLFFAMYVEELRSPFFPRRPTQSHPSRLPILRVSKYFHQLGLPNLYESPNITGRGAPSMAKQLQGRPDLGSFIRFIFLPDDCVPNDSLHIILSHATNVQSFLASEYNDISTEFLDLMARKTGPSLRELSIRPKDLALPTSLLAHFTELRFLELRRYTSLGSVTSDSTTSESDVLNTLHTLHIHGSSISFLHVLVPLRLASIHTLSLPFISSVDAPLLIKFFKEHGGRLLHLTIGDTEGHDFKIFDFCRNLIDLEFHGNWDTNQLFSKTPHESLVKISAKHLSDALEKPKFDMFPALREIHILTLKWPTTEREINKSEMVPFAESLLLQNIKLMNSTGKHWTPRVKTTKSRKR
ncbi:hypothetical protein B0H11DRAFT_121952 [Mycena galericulata]|nr:hypothetical protein B0H11DRAFT_121952 [Mycena galericulata]